MVIPSARARELLRLTLTPGVGPILARRLVEHFGTLDRMLGASTAELRRVEGIGEKLAPIIAAGLRASEQAAEREVEYCGRAGVRLVARDEPGYPPLLAQVRDAPPVLYIRGEPDAMTRGYTVAVVGSRGCTPYGIEQAERFSAFLASSGLVIVSGGARGIDSAAHRAALRVGGSTVAVLGCGLSHDYPPENTELFASIAGGGGAVVSELPMQTPPGPDNFPARNRIISGLCLGVLVIEAPRGSGAIITARFAVEEHGREVMAVPGRIDSPASEGCNDLIRKGEAAMVTAPGDVLEQLESPARHLWVGTHGTRYSGRETVPPPAEPGATRHPLFAQENPPGSPAALTDRQRTIVGALDHELSLDELVRATGLDAGAVQSELTILELRRLIRREGGTFVRK